MAWLISYEDAKEHQITQEGNGTDRIGANTHTPFFEFRDQPDLPNASLAQQVPGRYSGPHFHLRDQFQIIVDGKGRLGRHDLSAYCVHFSRAYTPYGPLLADAVSPWSFFVLRAHYDSGSHRLPQEKVQLQQVPERKPWQITRPATFPENPCGTAGDVMLQAVPGITDDHGLAAYTLNMNPNTKAYAPDPSHGDGQYLVVLKGSLLHDNKEYKAPALVFVAPSENPLLIHAGAREFRALVLNFPLTSRRGISA